MLCSDRVRRTQAVSRMRSTTLFIHGAENRVMLLFMCSVWYVRDTEILEELCLQYTYIVFHRKPTSAYQAAKNSTSFPRRPSFRYCRQNRRRFHRHAFMGLPVTILGRLSGTTLGATIVVPFEPDVSMKWAAVLAANQPTSPPPLFMATIEIASNGCRSNRTLQRNRCCYC